MRFVVGLLVCGCTVNLALAEDPPSAPAAAPAATAAPAAPATPAPPANTTVNITAKAELDRDIQHFTQEGYKPEMRGGQEVYCRRETALGSRLTPVKNCGTLEQLKMIEKTAKAGVEQSQRQQTSGPMGQ